MQPPFPSSHIDQILHVESYAEYLSWFQGSLRSAENVGAVGGRNFGLSIDLAHRLYNTIQYNTMKNLHSKTDKHTVSLI